jgi:hypothetical protein
VRKCLRLHRMQHLTVCSPCSEFKKRQKANQVAEQKAEKAVSGRGRDGCMAC